MVSAAQTKVEIENDPRGLALFHIYLSSPAQHARCRSISSYNCRTCQDFYRSETKYMPVINESNENEIILGNPLVLGKQQKTKGTSLDETKNQHATRNKLDTMEAEDFIKLLDMSILL